MVLGRLGVARSERYFGGPLAEIRIWSKARTQSEIQADMTRTLTGSEPNLLSYWPLTEGSAADIGPGGSHGQIHGNPGTVPFDKVRIQTGEMPLLTALKLDGQDDYVDLGGIDFARGDYTLEAWFATAGSYEDVLAGTVAGTHGVLLEINKAGQVRYFHRAPPGTNNIEILSETAFNDGEWHHAACVRSGADIFLYVDGEPAGRNSGAKDFDKAIDMVLGRLGVARSERYFGGPLAEIRIWSKARTQSEIQADMTRTLTGSEPNLLSYWPLTEGSAADIGPGGSHGQIHGNPGTVPFDKVRIQTGEMPLLTALKLDGQDDYVDLGGIDFARGDYTVEAWFATAGSYEDVLAGTVAGTHGVLLEINKAGQVRYFHRAPPGTNNIEIRSETAFNDGEWHHAACVRSGADIFLYVDGEPAGRNSGAKDFDKAIDMVLGRLGVARSERYFGGPLAEIRIWSKARTQSEIQADMTRTLTGSEPNLLSYWPLTEGSAADIGPGGSHGQIHGNPGTVPFDKVRIQTGEMPLLTALKLDGQDDYVDLGGIDFARGDYTVEAWFATAGSYEDILAGTVAGTHGVLVEINKSGQVRYFHRSPPGTNNIEIRSETAFNDGEWHHAACVRSGADIFLYVDGEPAGRNSGAKDFDKAIDMVLGRLGAARSERYFGGPLAEIRIWGKARSQSEIRADMTRTLTGSEPNLLSYWPLTEGSAADIGPGGSHGQIHGNPGTVPFDKVRIQTGEMPLLTALKLDGQDDYVDLGGIDFARGITLSRHGLPPPAVTRMFSLARSPAPTASFSKSTKPDRCAIFTAPLREPTTSRSVPKPPSMTGSGTMRHVSEAARTYSSMLTASPQAGTRARRTLTRQ
ncbi:Concanavalin A-like lectin/glucanases domain-containing protein [Desulfonema magnum]|uniref:Concanavalin A-like lectin/glucanases domain-containing protein n=1 Tax=Desulfonema magnum TaxID=45655 RepID=A0A975GPV4_9BACT|nr:Concanavalin A-like lectin/glucanases domain-containing protein [Desulfonema magnum]